ncbi:hypothetical protein [Streptomyces sp. NPDC002187]|uniref:hypothetical protein n=1 Tax=Streptomyces sp. NPDC002187 TaxID=3364637 RepID=UPI0036BB29E4
MPGPEPAVLGRALKITGARITGALDLKYATIDAAIRLSHCQFDGVPDLHGAQLRQLNLSNSVLPGLTSATLRVEGVVRMTDCRMQGPVRLGGAQISGALFTERAEFTAPDDSEPVLQLNQAAIGDDLWAPEMRAHGQVRLTGASVAGRINVQDAEIQQARWHRAGRAEPQRGSPCTGAVCDVGDGDGRCQVVVDLPVDRALEQADDLLLRLAGCCLPGDVSRVRAWGAGRGGGGSVERVDGTQRHLRRLLSRLGGFVPVRGGHGYHLRRGRMAGGPATSLRCSHVGVPPQSGNTCYRAGMAKTQLGARVDQEVAELARKRAADLGLSIGDYLARLVQDDASGLRARSVDAAARFLAEHQGVFDEAEDAQQTSSAARAA